ncbi:hypothetical protein DFH07DRAFT_948029 [Mycena maculata]|uniref:Uncharacterized protein n=1 Tax=Mycena maculata TaxID=230809 RepID=A0AAD7P1U3_9AGAR|nr:hypothetical protein DFH07DRAFT_948029 [Mycena maculata]
MNPHVLIRVYTDAEVVAATVGGSPVLASLHPVITTPIFATQPVLPKRYTSVDGAPRTESLPNEGEWDAKHPSCSLMLPAAAIPAHRLRVVDCMPPFNTKATLGPGSRERGRGFQYLE